MAALENVVLLSQSQFETLASGGTIGGITGVDNSKNIYLVDRNGFENAEALCEETSIPSGTATDTSVSVSSDWNSFDMLVIMVQSGTAGNYAIATIPANMTSIYNSTCKLVIKGQSTYYATCYFVILNASSITAHFSSNRATSVIIYGVNV